MPEPAFDSRRIFSPVIDEFTEAWEQGAEPAVEAYLNRLDPADSQGAVELIYREYCLAEADGRDPDPSSYFDRFPRYREPLERLLCVHAACSPSLLDRWLAPGPAEGRLPDAGDSIGPYLLRRELGRGSFARVFLAAQADLENRLVVVKVATRATREPWLLARARHAHIVEIVSHALVDDGAFQLICMPFWGGATLAAVLAARPQHSRVARSGRDFLTDLDAVAAPEYPALHLERPAREILSRLSYPQALAWIVARLADALNHAFIQGVAHGDVKPSNILLAADANPMLLDFNLAREDRPAADAAPGRKDPGGTLAYMAPERLRALASLDRSAGEWPAERAGDGELAAAGSTVRTASTEGREPIASDPAPHHADLYSLGMVLLEALTGRPPVTAELPSGAHPRSGRHRLETTARAYAAARDRDARALIRDAETTGRRAIPPGLRTILGHCLASDPDRRYLRASELAEDLDRWRTDRPLVFAEEPFWSQTLPRWMRRNQRVVATAALAIAAGLLATLVVWHQSARALHQTLQDLATRKLARHWDHADARTYRYQRPQAPHFLEPDDPQTVEAALQALNDYEVLGPADWRQREDVRSLPAADREDLELWILEQTYRYCRALDNRHDSPADWVRARELLDRVTASLAIPAFEPLHHRLRAKLGVDSPPTRSSSPSSAPPAPPWVDRYLRGVQAECEPEDPDISTTEGGPIRLGTVDVAAVLDDQARACRRAAEQALRHYGELLEIRPDSFWGHYRAAVAAYALDRQSDPNHSRIAEAAGHIEQCLSRRPTNPVLRGQLSGCLMALRRYPEALRECDLALKGAPEQGEFYRTRAFIRTKLGQTGGLDADIHQFELRSRVFTHSLWNRPEPSDLFRAAFHRAPISPSTNGLSTQFAGGPDPGAIRNPVGEVALEELQARTHLAWGIHQAGNLDLAKTELDKILRLEPNHMNARLMRVEHAIETLRFDDARRELDAALDHPALMDYLCGNPDPLRPFSNITRLYLRVGKVEEARRVARRACDLAGFVAGDSGPARHRPAAGHGEALYNLARVYAVSGRSEPRFVAEASQQLERAFLANPDFRQWYRRDRWFDPVRIAIDAELHRLGRPIEVRGHLEPNARPASVGAPGSAPS